MATQDTILRLLLESGQLTGELAKTVQQWVEATRRMDEAADKIKFDEAKREADSLRSKIEALAISAVKEFARIDAAHKQMAEEFGASAANVRKVETAIGRFAAKAEKDFNKIQAAAEKLDLRKAQDQAKLVGKSYEELEASVRKSFIAARKAADELNLQKARDQAITTAKSYQELEASVRKSFIEARKEAERISLEKARREAELTKQAIDSLASSAAGHFRAMEAAAAASGVQIQVGIGGGLTRLNESTQQLRAQFETTIAAMRAASDRPTFERLRTQAVALQSQITRLGNQSAIDLDKMRQASQKVSSGFSELSGVASKLRTILASLGIIVGARQLVEFAKSAVQASIRLESFRVQLDASTNSLADSANLFQFATTQTERLGLSYASVVEGTARFAAATKESNLSLEERKDILKNVFEAARVLNLSEQRLGNTLLAVEQIASKSTVSMEELRRQLGDNLPGAVAILAKEYGVTQQELVKLIEANRVFSDEALKALFSTGRGFSEVFGHSVPQAIETTAAKIGRLQKQLFDIKIAFATGFGEEFGSAVEQLGEILKDLEPAAAVAGKAISLLVSGVSDEAENLVFIIDKTRRAWEQFADTPSGRILIFALQAISQHAQESSTGIVQLTDTWSEFSTLVPETAARVVAGIGSIGDEVRELQEALSAAADAAELANLEIAAKSLAHALSLAAQSGKLTEDQTRALSATVEFLILRYEEAGEDIPRFLRQAADAAGITLRETRTAAEQVSDALEDARSRAEKLADEFRGSREDVEKLTEAFLDLVSGLDLTQLTDVQLEKLRGKLEEVIKAWELLGEAVPSSIQQIADELSVTTEVIEKELEDQSKAAEEAAKADEEAAKRRIQALERIGDAFLKLSQQLDKGGASDGLADLNKQLDALRDEEQDLTFGIEADPERLQEVQAEIEAVREQIRNFTEDQTALGEETAKTANIIDDAIKGLIDQIVPLLGSLNDSQEQSVQSILKNLQVLGVEGAATGDDVASALQQMVEVFQSAGLPVEELQSALSELQTGTLDIEKAFAAARREFEESGESLEDVSRIIKDITEQNKELGKLLEERKGKLKALVDAEVSELKRATGAWGALISEQERSLELCAALKDCLAGAG